MFEIPVGSNSLNISKKVSLNLDVRGLGQSATLAINESSKQLIREGKHVIRLGLGQSPFPVPRPVVETLKERAHEKDYLPAKGLLELRQAVAEYQCKNDQIERHADHVIIGPGSKELMFLLQLTFYGELIVPSPCWVSYVPQAKILGRRISLINTQFDNKWKVTAEDLARHCELQQDQFRPRILVLNYPGNPDGCTYTADQLKELAQVARQYEVVLLSDEIYGQLHHEGLHASVARFYPEGTIVSSGLSKWCGAGGWRLGTFTFPPDLDWLLESMASVASETYTSVCAPIQYAAVTAFQGSSEIEQYLLHVRRILKRIGNEFAETLRDSGASIHSPDGAFYLFPDFSPLSERMKARGIRRCAVFCERLLCETGVAIIPGESFGRPAEEFTVRLAYVDFNGAEALAASEAIPIDQPLPDDFTRRHCPNVVKAADLLADWVTR
jgi:aspartate aminotransferase